MEKQKPFGEFSLIKLREECRKRGAKISGRKGDLVDRLESYERNNNFGMEELPKECSMVMPEAVYKDINTDSPLPHLNESFVNAYLHPVQCTLSQIAKSLYYERFINFTRYTLHDNLIYIKSEVKSQMKKLKYSVNLMLDTDGVILQCECEYASGMGPHAHCKHVQTVLFGLTVYSKENGFKCSLTCTDKLQTFHVAHKYSGSPLLAQSLRLPVGQNLVYNPTSSTGLSDDDAYQTHFFNIWKAVPDAPQRPIFQIFEPVNMAAYVNDHNYGQFSLLDTFLYNYGLLNISEDKIKEIEKVTMGQNLNKKWHEEIIKRITSSNFGRICKATDRTNFSNLAKMMLSPKNFNSPAISHGQKYENVAIKIFEKQTTLKVTNCGLYVAKTYPFMAASPDGIIRNLNNSLDVVEVKRPYIARDKIIDCTTVPYLSATSEGLTLKDTHDYYYQIQGQMFCTGAIKSHFIIYTLKDIKIINVFRDETFINNMIMKLNNFYEQFFKQTLIQLHFFKHDID